MPAAPGPRSATSPPPCCGSAGRSPPLAIMKGVFIPSMVNLLVPLAVTSYSCGANRWCRPARRCGSGRPNHPLRAQPDVLPGARHPDRGAGVQDGDPSAAFHGHPVRARHSVDGRRTAASREGGRSTRTSDPGAGADAHRHGSIVFFIGILLAVATLEHAHILRSLAHGWINGRPPD